MKKTLYAITMVIISLLLITTIVIVNQIFKHFDNIEETLKNSNKELRIQIDELSAGISIDNEIKRKKLHYRDFIINTNSSITPDEAMDIVNANFRNLYRFPSIDEKTLFTIQAIESHFRPDVESSAGALGINQIIPSTGRLLCRVANIEYSKDILMCFDKSTYLALIYLDILFTQHEGNLENVIAEYNGGPRAVWLLQNKPGQLYRETKNYIIKFNEIYEKL